jgi:predicted nucleotidyltransferase
MVTSPPPLGEGTIGLSGQLRTAAYAARIGVMGIEGRRPRPRLADELVQALSGVNEAHGRSLAKVLGADSGAVARALVRLERKGTVSSHWAGRTRLYRLRGSRTRRVEPLLREAIERLQLVNDPRPLAILPFGSRARGQGRPDSDLDLIVIVPDGKTDYGSWERLSEAVRGLRVPVDLIVYSQTQARRWARLPANPLRDALDLGLQVPGDFRVA